MSLFHQERFPFGINGVECDFPSTRVTTRSLIKSIGRSGLSRAVRPIIAQNSICPAMVRCSALAWVLACPYRVSFIRTGIPIIFSLWILKASGLWRCRSEACSTSLHGGFHQVEILDLQRSERGVADQLVIMGTDNDGDPFLVYPFQVFEDFQ